jgi:GntR family transcriptional regulator, rspAB operon transcriptional repressor
MASIQRRAADLVFEQLHERIVSGVLAPGARLDPTEIAGELGVSRTPVREAILRLDSEGLVNRLPYRGVVVTGIDLRAAEEIAAVRIHLETLAAWLAVPRLTERALAEMHDANAPIGEIADGRRPQPEFNELNRRFHMALYQCAGTPVLLRTIENLASQADRVRMHFNLRHSPAHQHHEEILDACRRRDAESAAAATRDHILSVHRLAMPEGYQIAPDSPLARS